MASALLLIDIQNDYFPGGVMELVGMEEASKRAAELLNSFREKEALAFHIQHFSVRPGASFFLPDTPGVEIHDRVAPSGTEPVIPKNFPNAFRGTELYQSLSKAGVEEVTICGAMSHMCVDATVRAAFDHGFVCNVAQDACATRNLEHEGRALDAADVHAAFMSALSNPYATVANARDL